MSKKRHHKPGPMAQNAGPDSAADAAVEDGAGDRSVATAPVEPGDNDGDPVAAAAPVLHADAPQADVRGVMIQVAGAKLLLPNATIAEVLSYADPEPVGDNAPQWLLGRLRWRGWQVPLIAFGTLAGLSEERGGLGSKVLVLKALDTRAKTPYVALLTQGFPRLVTVSPNGLVLEEDDSAALPPAVQARVRLNEDEALLPDLETVEGMVANALAQAA